MGHEISLGRVRVGGATALDPVLARLRLEAALAGGAREPSALAPSAVLCVRHLDDPRPGSLRLDSGGQRPPPEWDRAFAKALEAAMAGAARPARGAVPAGAGAVLFADRAELLACLARDACDGSAHTRWWWRSLLRSGAGAGAGAAVVTAWLEEPQHAPAALELLAAGGGAVAFVRSLADAAALELAVRVARTFGARALLRSLGSSSTTGAGRGLAPPSWSPRPPWNGIVPEARGASLTAAGDLTLGVLLSLRREPVVARSDGFAAQTATWLAAVACGEAGTPSASGQAEPSTPIGSIQTADSDRPENSLQAPPGVPGGRGVPVPPGGSGVPAPTASEGRPPAAAAEPLAPGPPPDEHVSSAGTPVESATRDGPERASITVRDSPPAASPSGRLSSAADLPDRRVEDGLDLRRDRATQTSEAVSTPRPAAPAQPGLTVARPPAPRAGRSAPPPPAIPRSSISSAPADPPKGGESAIRIDTGLGGLFYLLNLALALDLYSDFTRPLDPGIALDPWDFTCLLGVRLLGRREPDPIWGLLAELAGRPTGVPPGQGFRPARSWRVPVAWLEPLEHEGAWRWSAAAGLLRLFHPTGFPVVAVPRTSGSPAQQLHGELQRLGPFAPGRALVRDALPREPKRPLARWTGRVAAYAVVRLRVALGLTPDERVSDRLLAHRAQVLVSPSHIDVVLSLAELPISIRLAGLDRDPGWIPAAGRHLAFHFR